MAMRRSSFCFSLNDADVTEKYDILFMKTSQSDAAPAYGQETRDFLSLVQAGAYCQCWLCSGTQLSAKCYAQLNAVGPSESTVLCMYNGPKCCI